MNRAATVLPPRHRMRRSADFGATVRCGLRTVQPDIVVHSRVAGGPGATSDPLVGLIVARSVGSAVQRHRVARRLRHAARDVLAEMAPAQRLVIRALPSSARATSAALRRQLQAGLTVARRSADRSR